MRLLRSSEVEFGASDRVFRHARWRGLILWLVAFSGGAAMFFNALVGKWKPGYISGPVILLFLLTFLRYVTARFHPSNWLVRANEIGLSAKYRSYLNYQMPADEPTVVFIPYGEIATARLVRERVQTPDLAHSGGTQTQFLRYIELELAGDTTPLANALQVERTKKPVMKKHWYGSGSTLYHDYPLTMNAPPFLRIRWDVVPGASRFLDYLHAYTSVAEPVSLTQDFTQLQSLTHEQQQIKLRDLVTRGGIINATYIAQKLYGCSFAQARTMLHELTDREQPT